MLKMRAIPQLVSALLNPIQPILEHFRRVRTVTNKCSKESNVKQCDTKNNGQSTRKLNKGQPHDTRKLVNAYITN